MSGCWWEGRHRPTLVSRSEAGAGVGAGQRLVVTQGGAWPVSAPSPAPTLAIQAASYHQTPDLITVT